MAVKIATAPCSWGVWYADGTPSKTPYELFLDQAAQAGYKALELGPDGYLPTALERLRAEGLLPMRIFYAGSDGSFSEVTM